MRPVPPSEVLREEFNGIDIADRIMNLAVSNKRYTDDDCEFIARVTDTSPEFWKNMRDGHDRAVMRDIGRRIINNNRDVFEKLSDR